LRHKTNTRSSLFLMELIIAILFFSLASAVCLRMFAKSHQLSTDASAGNQAVNQTVNVAELIRYDLQNDTRTLSDTYPEADILYSVVSNAADVYNGSFTLIKAGRHAVQTWLNTDWSFRRRIPLLR
jgi:flagellar basal body-associated protein FliL